MTIKKSLQVKAGYQHRIHRTKKNRRIISVMKRCWYCRKRFEDKGLGQIFCAKCEKLKIKDVPRSECENYWMKV